MCRKIDIMCVHNIEEDTLKTQDQRKVMSYTVTRHDLGGDTGFVVSKDNFFILIETTQRGTGAGEARADISGITSTFKFTAPAAGQLVACTKDAFMCPDGTNVGRSGSKCEFVCPVTEKCSTPLAYDDKENTSISCVEGIYTPDQVIALAERLNGNQIEIKGYISMQVIPGSMPTGGPAFHTSTGNIFMNGVSGVYGADKSKQVSIRGVFSYSGKDNYFLTIPIYCKDCVKTI
jgi:hypothetical protein